MTDWARMYRDWQQASGSRGRSRALDVLLEAVLLEALRSADRRYGMPRADQQDAAQESAWRVCRRLDQCRDAASFGGWVQKVVRSRCVALLRRRHDERRGPANVIDAAEDRAPGPERRAMDREQLGRVRKASASLSPALRRAYLLRFEEGRGIAAIARALGVDRAVVDTRLRRARQYLECQVAG